MLFAQSSCNTLLIILLRTLLFTYATFYPSTRSPPQAKDAHAGVVRNYTAPTPPQAPALPTDLAAELSKFDAEEPTIGATSAAKSTGSSTEEVGEGAQEFLAFLEKDLPKEEAHH